MTVTLAESETPTVDAVKVTTDFMATPNVWTGKVALDAPTGTVSVLGTVAPASTDRETTMPPAGAALARVTVPVAVFPPMMDEGAIETLARYGF